MAQDKLELVAEPGKPTIVTRRGVAAPREYARLDERLAGLLSGTPAEAAP